MRPLSPLPPDHRAWALALTGKVPLDGVDRGGWRATVPCARNRRVGSTSLEPAGACLSFPVLPARRRQHGVCGQRAEAPLPAVLLLGQRHGLRRASPELVTRVGHWLDAACVGREGARSETCSERLSLEATGTLAPAARAREDPRARGRAVRTRREIRSPCGFP